MFFIKQFVLQHHHRISSLHAKNPVSCLFCLKSTFTICSVLLVYQTLLYSSKFYSTSDIADVEAIWRTRRRCRNIEEEEEKNFDNGNDDLPFKNFQDDLIYRAPNQSNVRHIGRPFQVDKRYTMEHFHAIDASSYVTLTPSNVKNFVVVTAADNYHSTFAIETIASVQQHFPGYKIFYYDIETSNNTVAKEKVSTLCDVEYRRFNFSDFPDHIQNLKYYCWKPLIVNELLAEYAGVWWMDSSVRVLTNNLTDAFRVVIEHQGPFFFSKASHSNFATTDPYMYSYLPTSVPQMIRVQQWGATTVLFYRTRSTVEHIIRWWVMCALDKECMAPANNLYCNNPHKAPERYASCHRYDQSALNILTANYFSFNETKYGVSNGIVKIRRRSRLRNVPRNCTGRVP